VTHGLPPPEALSWAAQAAGPDLRVVSCTLLEGTSFHANHALVVVDGFGRRREFVLRRWAGAGWEATDAEFNAEREAAILGLLEGSSVPAPRLVAADLTGGQCLVPALLMTLLPGRPPSPSLRLAVLLGGLAEVLAAIHAVNAAGLVPGYRRYHEPAALEPPRWAKADPGRWNAALEIAAGPAPAGRECFVHRDFHPGNTLWEGARLTGVVDWSYGSLGPAAIDAAHLRWNLALDLGPEGADALLPLLDAPEHHPYWDIVDVLDLVGEPGFELSPGDRARLDSYLDSLLRRL
jgi:aminoglycoside phosphotransferase (APT) family kinase protein